jgi:hypothetical protein
MDVITITLRVTAPSPSVARVSAGRRQFAVGRPVEFDDASAHVAALEYALGAIGGEVVNGLREFARRKRVPIDDLEAVVTGDLQRALAYLEVIGEPGPPRLGRVSVKLFAAAPDPARVRAIFDDMLERLPLRCTLRDALDLTIDLIFTS